MERNHLWLCLPAGVNDGVVGHAGSLELSTDEGNGFLHVLSLVVGCVGSGGELSGDEVTMFQSEYALFIVI